MLKQNTYIPPRHIDSYWKMLRAGTVFITTIMSYRFFFAGNSLESRFFVTAAEMDENNDAAEKPQTSSIINFIERGRLPFVGITTDIKIHNNYAFIATEDAGLQIVDIHDPSSLSIVGHYNTTYDSSGKIYPIYDIELKGDFAYLAEDMGGLRILDITNVTNIVVAEVYYTGWRVTQLAIADKKAWLVGGSIANNFALIDISEPHQIMRSGINIPSGRVYVDNDIAYVATAVGVYIVNISNPTNLRLVGNYATTQAAQDVSVSDNIAYIITFDRLHIIGLANPANPQLLGSYKTSGIRLCVSNNIVYVAGSSGISMKIFNVSDVSNPQFLGGYTEGNPRASITYKSGITISDNLVYMVAQPDYESPSKLQIINVSTLTSPQTLGNYAISGIANDIVVSDDIAYITVSNRLEIIDVSNAGYRMLSNFNTSTSINSIKIENNVAYIITKNELVLVDVHKPSIPKFKCSYFINGGSGVSINDKFAYISSNIGLIIIDTTCSKKTVNDISYYGEGSIRDLLADPSGLYMLHSKFGLTWLETTSTHMHTVKISAPIQGVTYRQNLAYLAANSAGLIILNISNPARPLLLSNYTNLVPYLDVSVTEGLACMRHSNGFHIIDISKPIHPRLLGKYNVSSIKKIQCENSIAYFLAEKTLQMVDIKNPTNPKLLSKYRGSSGDDVNDVMISESIAYLGDNTALQIIDVDDLANPQFLANYISQKDNIWDIAVSDNVVYASIYAVRDIIIINVKNPSNPRLLGIYTDHETSGSRGFDKISAHNKIVYAKRQTNSKLKIIDMTDHIYPELLGNYIIPDAINSFSVNKGMVLVAGNSGLHIITKAPLWDTRFPMEVLARKMAISSKHSYIIDNSKILHIIDIQNKRNITEVSANYQLIASAQKMIVADDFLYVAERTSGIEVVDVYNSISPQLATYLTKNIYNAIQLTLHKTQLFVIDAKAGLIIFDIVGQPLLVNHQFMVNPGADTIVTSNELSARDTNIGADSMRLTFMINNMEDGRFEWITHPGFAITNFTQQAIHHGKIKLFSSEPDTLPSFRIRVTNGVSTSTAINAIVRSNANIPPRIVNNRLIINEGESVVISNQSLSALDLTVPFSKLRFITNDIINGRFEQISKPGMTLTNFLGQNISSDHIKFVHTGSGFDKPSYKVTASNGQLESLLSDAVISFNAAPKLIKNQLFITRGSTLFLTNENLQAIDIDDDNATLTFTISQVKYGAFNQLNFTQNYLTQGHITFTHDGSDQAPIYWVNVSDRHMNVGPQKAVTSLSIPINSTAIAIGATAGGVALGTMITLVIWYRRRAVEANTRKHNPFADYVRDALKLKDVDNFKSQKGKYYVSVIQKLRDEFAQQGNSLDEKDDKELRDIAKMVAEAARNKITTSSTLFGYSLITTAEIESKVKPIVQEVVRRRVGVLDEESGVDLDNLAEAAPSTEQDSIIG